MYKIGIRGIALDFIKSYLTDRVQFVELNGDPSDLQKISCGVPQGSILGPMLFLLYINDLHLCTKLLNLFLFADDTTIVFTSTDLNFLIASVNRELQSLSNWFAQNKLSVNVSKTNYMIFKTYPVASLNMPLLLDGKSITRVSSTKFLGVIIDERLAWKPQALAVEKKLAMANFIIRKIRYKININTALKLYDALILSHMNYCNLIWGNTCKSYTQNISRLQKRTLKMCACNNSNKSDNVYAVTERLPFSSIHTMQIARLAFSYLHNPLSLPKCIASLFQTSSDIHAHQTRSSDTMCLFTHLARLNIRKNSVKICTPVIWNNLPFHIRHANSISDFKKSLRLHLIANL